MSRIEVSVYLLSVSDEETMLSGEGSCDNLRHIAQNVLTASNELSNVRYRVPIVKVLSSFSATLDSALYVEEEDVCAFALADNQDRNGALKGQFCGDFFDKVVKFDSEGYLRKHLLPGATATEFSLHCDSE